MTENIHFMDILGPRNTQFGFIRFMTRSWVPKKTLVLDKCYTPQELRDLVVKSVFMDNFLTVESANQGVPVEQLKKEMLKYLNEMAFEKKLHVVRWVGIAFLKVCSMMKIGLYVNETAILEMKEAMGGNPVLFLPTHRSYADFCIMTYLCYHYDIDIPAVAAGMDFHEMAIVGQRMREMCAFYIRRTLVGAPLYAATLRQYVRTVVGHHSAPIEFFLEGTRSRSNKSLHPKYGMLSMCLLPFFAREVSDITIVPVNISYDRIMELTLFAYEHIGVPKPRESTEGLIKSLQSLNDNFGNVYVNLGTPISVNRFLNGDVPNTGETLRPVDLQVLTDEQMASVQDLAHTVVVAQQECAVVTMPALLSMVVMQCLTKNRLLHMDEVLQEVEWLAGVFRGLGARVEEPDLKAGVERTLLVHRRMFTLDAERHLKLVCGTPVQITAEFQRKTKGHALRAETMNNAIPVIELQTYVNSALHYLVPPGLVFLIVRSGVRSTDECRSNYQLLRTLLLHEFFYDKKNVDETFNKALQYCIEKSVIAREGDDLVVGGDDRLQYLLDWVLLPTLTTLSNCIDVVLEEPSDIRDMMRRVQARSEASAQHPYCLSLDAISHCLRDLGSVNRLPPSEQRELNKYRYVKRAMRQWRELVRAVRPRAPAPCAAHSCVMVGRTVASRL